MEVAVLIGSHKLVAGCHGKGDLGLLTGLKGLALVALLGLEADPLDVVLLLHGVGDGTHGDRALSGHGSFSREELASIREPTGKKPPFRCVCNVFCDG